MWTILAQIFFFLHCQTLCLLLFRFLLGSCCYKSSISVVLLMNPGASVWEGSMYKHIPPSVPHGNLYISNWLQICFYQCKNISFNWKSYTSVLKRENKLWKCVFHAGESTVSPRCRVYFSDLTGKGDWSWDCPIPWEHPCLKGRRGLPVNPQAKT